MSTTDEVLALLPAYAAEELDVVTRERVARALAESASLREELVRYRRLFVLLVALAEEEVAPEKALERQIMRRIAIQWYLGTAARLVEGIAGAYGRAVLYYLGLGGSRS